MLDTQDSPDILYQVGSVDIPSSDSGRYMVYQVNQTHVKIFTMAFILTLDISDYTSPKVVSHTNFTQIIPQDKISPFISMDGETVVQFTEDDDIFVIKVSDPQNPMNLSQRVPDSLMIYDLRLCVFSSNYGGYLALADLYQFKTSSEEVTLVASFNSMTATFILLSSDGMTAFVGLSDGSLNQWLRIIDLTDPTTATILYDFPLNGSPVSGAISSDDNIIFIYLDEGFQAIDVSNRTNPTTLSSVGSNTLDSIMMQGLKLSPDDQTLIIWATEGAADDSTYVIDVSDPKNLHIHTFTGQTYTSSPTFSPDAQLVFMTFQGEFAIAKVFVNVRPQPQLSYSIPNLNVQTLSQDRKQYGVAITSDGQIALVSDSTRLIFYNITENRTLVEMNFLMLPSEGFTIILSADNRIAFVSSDLSGQVFLYTIPDGKYLGQTLSRHVAQSFHIFYISPDGKTLIQPVKLESWESEIEGWVDAFDLTGPNGPSYIGLIPNITSKNSSDMKFATNWEILVLLVEKEGSFEIYNVSNITSPVYINTVNLQDFDEQNKLNLMTTAISPDNQTLFILVFSYLTSRRILQVYDISNVTDVKFLRSITIGEYAFYDNNYLLISFIDQTTLTLSQEKEVLIIDFSTRSDPFIVSSIDSLSNATGMATVASYSDAEGPILLITAETEGLKMVTLTLQYDIEIPVPTVGRGQMLDNKALVLENSSLSGYTLFSEERRIIDITLYNVTRISDSFHTIYSALPAWIAFDSQNENLRMQPTSLDNIGGYYLSCHLATQLTAEELNKTLVNMTLSSDAYEPADLMLNLLIAGYIDQNYYLTSNFKPDKPLLLPQKYNDFEPAIRQTLHNHFFEIIKKVIVDSSLSLQTSSNPPSIYIQSLSQTPMSVSISLFDNTKTTSQRCQFVENINTRLTPVFDQETFTSIYFEGQGFEVNDLLANIILNQADDDTTCRGVFIIIDGLNPTLNQTVNNLEVYFKPNVQPRLNSSDLLQRQMDKSSLSTGEYFVVIIDNTIFNQQGLELELLNPEDRQWLNVNGFTLSGTAPDPYWFQFWPSHYTLTFRAANQYKFIDTTVSLVVNVSVLHYALLLLKMLTLLGLYIYFFAIFNILSKRLYLDPQGWVLKFGEKITPQMLFPIAFIGKEIKQSDFVMKKLRENVAKELSLKAVSKTQLAEYFMDSEKSELNMERLSTAVDDIIFTLIDAESTKLTNYGVELRLNRELLIHIVFNYLVISYIQTNKQDPTAVAFKRLQDAWRDIVQVDSQHLWKFTVSVENLSRHLEPPSATHTSIEKDDIACINGRDQYKGLLIQSEKTSEMHPNDIEQINLKLLASVLAAHAFKKHHVQADLTQVQIISSQKVTGNYPYFIGKVVMFLKFDLNRLVFYRGQKIGYGIKYKTKGNVLQFWGVAKTRLCNEKIVVQIVSKRGRMLKEMVISGASKVLEQTQQVELTTTQMTL